MFQDPNLDYDPIKGIVEQAAAKIKEEHARAEQAGSEARRLGKALGEAEAELRKKTLDAEKNEVELRQMRNQVRSTSKF